MYLIQKNNTSCLFLVSEHIYQFSQANLQLPRRAKNKKNKNLKFFFKSLCEIQAPFLLIYHDNCCLTNSLFQINVLLLLCQALMCQMVASHQPDPGLDLNNATNASDFYYN